MEFFCLSLFIFILFPPVYEKHKILLVWEHIVSVHGAATTKNREFLGLFLFLFLYINFMSSCSRRAKTFSGLKSHHHSPLSLIFCFVFIRVYYYYYYYYVFLVFQKNIIMIQDSINCLHDKKENDNGPVPHKVGYQITSISTNTVSHDRLKPTTKVQI